VEALAHGAPDVHALRDPTRGGLAAALDEMARDSRVAVEIDESAVPVPEAVASACGLLGPDPLTVADEGCLVAFVSAPVTDEGPGRDAVRAGGRAGGADR
jgi:hydrogenase expression/formation protein HypE